MGNLFPPCDKRLTAAIRNAGKAAVIAHRNPDGDALYSSLAMREVLSSLGKETYLLNEGPFLRDDIKYLEKAFEMKGMTTGAIEAEVIPAWMKIQAPTEKKVSTQTADKPSLIQRLKTWLGIK